MDCKKASGLSNTAFLRQPARVLIVEAVPPRWSDTRAVLCDALENFLTMVCSLKGPSRLPFLSVFAIGSQQQCLLPFAKVRGNLPRLLSCVAALRAIPGKGVNTELASVGEILRKTVLDSHRQFHQYRKFSGVHVQANISVEVTVVTSRPGKGLVSLLKNVLKDDDLEPINSFLVVQLDSEVDWGQDEVLPQDPRRICSAESLVLVDLRQVANSVFAVEGVLKEWLQEYGVDSEHLHLGLPSPRGSPAAVHVKCDVRESVISPGLLPLSPEKPDSLGDIVSASPAPRRMRAIKALRSGGVCQSMLYGLPLVVTPTTCWRLNWDEVESNRHAFQALNRTLQVRQKHHRCRRHIATPQSHGLPELPFQDHDQVLLLQAGPSDGGGPDLRTFYCLHPSPSLAMLLKPVVCQELFMPGIHSKPLQEPPPETMRLIRGCLSHINETAVLSPCCLSSNLYQYLRSIPVTELHRPSGASNAHASNAHAAFQTYQRQPAGGVEVGGQPRQVNTCFLDRGSEPYRWVVATLGSIYVRTSFVSRGLLKALRCFPQVLFLPIYAQRIE
ncbi:meiosis 1 arrest protein isoform X2 [Syngnathus scovelli]|uniref:meiosis 1 arrest protein isoform X2 n=1 Tax=Syngnathus scovelli TaxID=161590 RepID=UPI0021107ACB|nr:meiosis 1 arrest protein isoform X2 [Syngnathus scovelli]